MIPWYLCNTYFLFNFNVGVNKLFYTEKSSAKIANVWIFWARDIAFSLYISIELWIALNINGSEEACYNVYDFEPKAL
jgi:hypothetical protein